MRLQLTRRLLIAAFLGAAMLTAAPAHAQSGDFGVLVMAHGGGPQWNGEVETMLAPVARVSEGRGLFPSAEVEHWVRRQAEEMRGGEFRTPVRVVDAHQDHGGH